MINKTKLALGIATATLTLAGALISPQAAAGKKADACWRTVKLMH